MPMLETQTVIVRQRRAMRAMTQSEARRILSALTETMGKDGILVVHKDEERSSGRAVLRGEAVLQGEAAEAGSAEAAADAAEAAEAAEAADAEGPDDAWEDVVPGKALRWPKCECGSPKCPDYDALRTKVAERNRRSSRGGI
jgi:hypothetical protein